MNRLPSKLGVQVAEARPAEAHEEYWRPALLEETSAVASGAAKGADACSQCGTEFLMGAKFCHVCGNPRYRRQRNFGTFAASMIRLLDFQKLQDRLHLTAASLVLFIMGVACLLAAVFTGIVFSPATVLDWQAIQTWRVQWLIAAVALFTAGNMLKR